MKFSTISSRWKQFVALQRNSQIQAWETALMALVMCGLLVVLYRQQRTTLAHETAVVRHFRQTRLDLANGFTHVIAAGGPDSPFSKEQGYALLLQAVRQFEESTTNSAVFDEPARVQSFQSNVAHFRRLLNQVISHPELTPQDLVALRVAYHRLEAEGSQIDVETRDRLQNLSDQQDTLFWQVLGGFGGMLVAMWGFVYMSGRTARKAGTAREYAESNLRESESRERQTADLLKAVVTGTTDAVYVKDREGKYLFANLAVAKMVGRGSITEVIGQTVHDLLEPASAQRVMEHDQQAMEGNRPITEELSWDVTGVLRTYQITKAPYRDAQGQVIGILAIARDITERKRMEVELKKRELMLREAGELARIGGWEFNPLTQEGSWSDETARIYDLDPSDSSNVAQGLSYFHGEHRQRLEQAVTAAIQHGTPYDLELELISAKGVRKWVRSICRPILRDGQVVQVRGSFQDISDRKHAETTRALLASIVESADDAIISQQLNGAISSWNTAAERMFGFPACEALHQTPDFLVPDKQHAELIRLQGHLVRGERVEQFPTMRIHRNGQAIQVSLSQSPLYDSAGQLIGGSQIIRDITEERRFEALRLAVVGAEIGTWHWNIVTGELRWSTQCKRIFGIPLHVEMTYERFLEAIHPDDRASANLAVHESLASHTPYEIETRTIWPDGSVHWAVSKGRGYYDASGRAVRMEGAALDISDRKAAEEKISQLNTALEQRAAETLAANQELEAFSYSVSHDLRAPLRAINGFSRILLDDFTTEVSEEAADFLREIRRNTEHMGRLVDDLLEFSRLGRQAIRLQMIEHEPLVERCLNDLHLLEQDHVELRRHPLADGPGDANLIRQVWFNLLDNALKYSSKSAHPIVEIGMVQNADTPTYFVRDNGVGFDMRYAHKLFGVFQRLHRAEDYIGTGIGLALVQRILHRHGGRIWCDAVPDQGATFYFTLGKELPAHVD